MPGQYNIPGIPKPNQPTGGPKPPARQEDYDSGLSLEKEFQNPYMTWKANPSPEANDLMLKSLQPIIDNAIKTYTGSLSPIIKSKAKKIVVDTLPNYDPKNTKLKTYVFNQLQGLKRFSMQQNQIISIPEQVQLDHATIGRTEEQLKEELGRDPSTEELADATNLSIKRIDYVRKLRMPTSEGTISKPVEGYSDTADPSVLGRANEKDTAAWLDFVYGSLSPVDKVIMEHSFGMYGKNQLSNEEIAKKLRVSPAAVSIRKNKIQQELDKRYSLNIL